MVDMKKNLTLAFLLLVSVLCFANDTAGIVSETGGVKFLKQDGISMLKEALLIRNGEIEVNYIFKNTTNKDIETTVLFPVPAMPCFLTEDEEKGHDFNFKLFASGKSVPYKTAFTITLVGQDLTDKFKHLYKSYTQLPTEEEFMKVVSSLPEDLQKQIKPEYGLHDEMGYPSLSACSMGISFYWDQKFFKNKNLYIKHTYAPSMSYSSIGGRTVAYILTTANNWQGPIAQFDLLVEHPQYIMDTAVGKSIGGYYTAHKENFTPQENLTFYFNRENLRVDDTYRTLSKNEFRVGIGENAVLYKDEGKTPLCKISISEVYAELDLNNKTWSEHTSIYFPEKGVRYGRRLQIEEPLYVKVSDLYLKDYGLSGYVQIDFLMKSSESVSADAAKIKNGTDLISCTDYIKKYDIRPKLYQIDGPANIRQTPNGEIKAEVADNVYVWAVAQDGVWYRIITEETFGWTHKNNLKDAWNK